MDVLPAAPKMTVAEYLIADDKAERHLEYLDGEVFPIVDTTWNHSAILINLAGGIRERLKGGTCRAGVGCRVRASAKSFTYPDAVVVCGPMSFAPESPETVANPKVIIEVLSPSTADYDYGGKFAIYRRIPSLEEYILVSQLQPLVEVFRKTPEGNWTLFSYLGNDTVLRLQTLNIEIPLSQIYADIEFPAEAPDA